MSESQLMAMVMKARGESLTNIQLLPRMYETLTGQFCTQIFDFCELMGMSSDILFRTIELFDRHYILTPKEEGEMGCLMPIMHICVLLAYKLHETPSTPAIDLRVIKKSLCANGIQMTLSELWDLEIHVFSTLGHRTNWITLHDLVYQLISTLQMPNYNHQSPVTSHYIKMSYLKNRTICEKMKEGLDNLTSLEFKQRFEHNVPLRAAGVVAAISRHFCLHLTTTLCEEIGDLTGEPTIYISNLGSILFQIAPFTF